MTDPLLDLYQTRPTIWQQNQLNTQTSPVVTGSAVSTTGGTTTAVEPTQDPLLVEDNPYDDYADNTSRVALGINYQPPKWKEGETVHNYGSKVDSTRVFQDGSRFNIALKDAGYTPEMWLRTPYAIKRDILKKYAEQDFARLKPELQQAERSADKYFEKIAKAYGVGANDEYDDSALSVIADTATETAGGAVRGINSLISLADDLQNRMGINIDMGAQKNLGAITKYLQDMAGDEEVEGNSEYFNYLVDNDRIGDALEMAAKHPALLAKMLGPEVAAMVIGTKGLGLVGGAVGNTVGKGIEAGANLSKNGAKILNYIKDGVANGFKYKDTGNVAANAALKAGTKVGDALLKGAQYRTVSALQEAGGFRLEQYLNGRDMTTDDAKNAVELAFLEQYAMQGMLPGTVDNIAYNILNRSGKFSGAASKTINELKDFVKKADEGSILKRLNHKVDQIGGIGVVKRLATTAGKEYVDEFAANSFQDLLGQNLGRIQDPLIPEEQRAKAGSLSFASAINDGDLERAKHEGHRGGIVGLFMGVGAHPLGDAGHNVQAYKQAKADIADIDAQIAALDVSNYDPVGGNRETNDIQARADEIAQEFAQGDRTNEDEYKYLIREQQGKVTNLIDTVSQGNVSVEQANQILKDVTRHTDLVNKMTETLGKQQNIQNGTNPASMQGQFNDFASKFESARKAANFNDNDEYVQGVADEIRALRDPANIPAAEARLSEMKQSPMMGDAKFADMVGAYESAVNFAKDPQAYFQNVPAKDPDAKAKITSFTKDARAVVKEFDKDGIIPPALKDSLAKRGVTADELNTSVTGAINQLLQFANQAQQDGAPERAGRYAAAANRLLTAKLALVDLGQYADARNQNYEEAQKQSIVGERTAAENAASEIAQNEATEQAEEIKKQQAAFERQLVVDTKSKVRKVLETAHSGFIADPNAKGVSNNLGETRAEVEANLEKLIADTYQLAQKTPDLVAASALYKRSKYLQEVLNISRGLGGMQSDPSSQAGALLNQLYPDANVANRVANNVDMLARMAHVKVSVRGKNTVLTPAVDAVITALNGGALVNSKRVSKDIDLNLVRDEAVAYLDDVKAGRADDITAEQHPNLFKYVGDELIGTTKTSEKGKVAQEMTDETRETQAKRNAETREQERTHDKAFDELLTEVHNETMARTADEEMVKTKSKKSPKSSSELSRAILDPANKEHVDTIFRIGGRPTYEAAKARGATELDFEQWVQVRTPAFKRRFGDWERGDSRLLLNPRTGEPQVMYHGTAAGSNIHDVFKGFRESRDGVFVTPDINVASAYVRMSKKGVVSGRVKRDSSGKGFVHRVFIEQGNPFVFDAQANHASQLPRIPLYWVKAGKDWSVQGIKDLMFSTRGNDVYVPFLSPEAAQQQFPGAEVHVTNDIGNTRDIAQAATNSGHDGVIFRNIRLQEPGGTIDITTDYYTVANPDQLVSAQQHSGVYGNESANIFGDSPATNINPTTFKWALQDYGVMEALKFAKRGFAENDPRGRVVDKLVELVDDSVLIRYDNLATEGRSAYYDIASNMIVLDINSKEPDIDLIHELVHAYTVYALENRAALDEEQRAVVDEIVRAWENARSQPEFVAQFPTIADEVTGVHEFVAELLSNPKFQTAYDKLHANGAPRGFFDSVRAFFKRIGALLGLNSNEQPALFQLITNTTSLFEPNNGRTQTIKGVPGLSRKIVRQVIFAGRTQEQNRDSHIAAIAQLDEDNGLWSLNWWDEQGQSHEETGLTWDQTETLAQKSGFVPKHRSEMSQQEKYVQDVTEMAYNHSGLLYSLFKGIQRVLPPQFSEPVLRVLDRTIRWSAINLNNSTSWITTLENIAKNAYGAKVPVEVETRINALRQKASAELNHYGVGGKLNLRDHMDILTQLAQRSGMTKEDLDDLAYALRAPHFIRRKKRASGEQDPYYKGRDLLTDTITGFGYYVLNGKRVAKGTKGATWVKDDTGEKYMASLTPQQRAFAKEFEKAIIEMNNNTLDFELAMGRIDENTYNDLYGEFYVPLQNEDSEVKAFSGRIHGRSTKAGNILSKYVANSQARINNAAESAIMREAADLLAKYPMPHMARIMSDELKTRGDKFHATYAPEGILDGRSKAFYRNGKRERLVLTDEIVSQSLAKMSKAQKNNVTNTFIRHLGATTRWLGLTRTVLNPTFHITAFIRDMTLVLANTQAASRGKLSDAESLQLSGRIIPRMMRVLPMLLKGQWDGKNAHFTYKTYLNEGGINPMAHYDLDKITDDLDMLAFNRGSVGSRTARGAKTLMQVMHFSDNAARFSAWLEYLQMQNGGREFNSERDLIEFLRNNQEIANTARDISKNLTGNFEQKGAWGTPRSFWMFWNAIMGGVKTTYNLVNPKYGTYGLKAMGMLALLVAAQAAGDDEEDEDGTPMWKRRNESVGQFHLGDFKFPIAQELMIPLNAAREFVRVAKGEQEVSTGVERVMRSVQESLMPFQTPETDDTAFNVAYGWSPTVIQPVVSLVANKDYFGRAVAPKNGWAQDGSFIDEPMDYQRRNMNDSVFSQWLTFEMAKLGIADVAPSSIDTWINHFIGGSGKFIGDISKSMRFEGKDPVSAFNDMLVKKYSLNYNEYAVEQEFDKEYTKLMNKMGIGESYDELLNLEQDGARKELKKWVGEVRKAEKALRSSKGNSTGDLFTMKKELELQLNPPLDELLDIKEQLNEIQIKKKFLYMDALEELKQRGERYD